MKKLTALIALALALFSASCVAKAPPAPKKPTEAEIRADARYADWVIRSAAPVGGGDFLLVEYVHVNEEYTANRFDLWNLVSGRADTVAADSSNLTLLRAFDENHLLFESDGTSTESPIRAFPHLVRWYSGGGAITEDEYFELNRSVEAGDKSGVLGAVAVTLDGVEVMYKPYDDDNGEWIAAATSLLPTKTLYDAETNTFTVEIDTETLGAGLQSGADAAADDNLYISSYRIEQNGGKTQIVLTLRDAAQRYRIRREDHGGDFPYFSLRFTDMREVYLDYLG
jgi:hypothetical protein